MGCRLLKMTMTSSWPLDSARSWCQAQRCGAEYCGMQSVGTTAIPCPSCGGSQLLAKTNKTITRCMLQRSLSPSHSLYMGPFSRKRQRERRDKPTYTPENCLPKHCYEAAFDACPSWTHHLVVRAMRCTHSPSATSSSSPSSSPC